MSSELEIASSAFFAAVACLLCIAATGHRLMSFVSVAALSHLVFYPVAATLNLMLEQPAVRSDLWASTPLAMWACALGCFAMAIGATLRHMAPRRNSSRTPSAKHFIIKAEANLCIWAAGLAPAVLLQLTLGLYDARFVEDVLGLIEKTQHYNNVIAYLMRIAQVGMLLQLYRAMNTRSTRDFIVFFGMAAVFVLAFLPTGSRGLAYGWVPWFFVFYLTLERKSPRAASVLVVLLAVFSILTVVAGYYRIGDQYGKQLADRYQSMAEIAANQSPTFDESKYLEPIVERLSDYTNTGRIIDYTPGTTPFRGAHGLDQLWIMAIPKIFIRERATLASLDASMDDYGVTEAYLGRGSSPCMIIGDLFSRWGWAGVIVGMFLIGVVLAALSKYCLDGWTVQNICFYALFAPYVAGLHNVGVFVLVVSFTRELLICWLISKVMAFVLTGMFSKVQNRQLLGKNEFVAVSR
ncbi:MAG: O-antigen polysaccharide polymerase Wzy [Desulfomonile tiedjei]|uniref:O-antigen polysaccharide polymerase Wzy n=1 Tax=Desulfomonile tiedjei TaxID=2358 RepID=A0A9D6V6G7_9BACT|nr:O-antigen polysaccharide polymerase Wzy [Desulfomonile tiedjei]